MKKAFYVIVAIVLLITSIQPLPVSASEIEPTYTITLQPDEHGGVWLDSNEYTSGSLVPFRLSPEAGYITDTIQIINASNGESIPYQKAKDMYVFTMPSSDVTLATTFHLKTQGEVVLTTGLNGVAQIVTTSENSVSENTYTEGDWVVLEIQPDELFEVEKIAVVPSPVEEVKQIASNQYGFYMPNGDCQVSVNFQPAGNYQVILPNDPDFSFTASPSSGKKGDSVTIHIEEIGMYYAIPYATDANGKVVPIVKTSDNNYQIYLPGTDVTITYDKYENIAGDPTDGGEIPSISWNTSTTHNEGEPDITLGKGARWTDIENGIAEITLMQQDTSAWSSAPNDFIIVIDRSDSTTLNRYYCDLPGGIEAQAPCMNTGHFYLINSSRYYLMSWRYGRKIGSTKVEVLSEPYLWNKHYNLSTLQRLGVAHFVDRAGVTNYLTLTSDGCISRTAVEKTVAKRCLTLIEQYDNETRAKIEAEQGTEALNNTLRSRVAFWSFEGNPYSGTSDAQKATSPGIIQVDENRDGVKENKNFSTKGLSQYIGFTPITSKTALVNKINAVGAGGGTSYEPSFQLAYDLILNKEGTPYEGIGTKFIFITDGADMHVYGDVAEAVAKVDASKSKADEYAALIKNYTGADNYIFGVACAMNPKSPFTSYLRDYLASDLNGKKAFYTAGVNMDPELTAAVKDATLATTEIKATQKVLTDRMSDYFEATEIVSCDGSAQVNGSGDTITWNIPEGAGTEYTCTVRVQLKEEYRYKIADTQYPTNLDTADDLGAKLSYNILGGAFNGQAREVEKETPMLKYGVTEFFGVKNWTVTGSEPESLVINLTRNTPSMTPVIVSNATLRGEDYSYRMRYRYNSAGTRFPLLLYNNMGAAYTYHISESISGYQMRDIEQVVHQESDFAINGGYTNEWNLFNEANKAQVTLEKVDSITKEELQDAIFTVYEYTGSGSVSSIQNYKEYTCSKIPTKEEYYADLNTNEVVTVRYNEALGKYQATQPLYRTPSNQGYFKIIETTSPNGYLGDWKKGIIPTESSTYRDKNTYDILVPLNETDREFVIFNNTETQQFDNIPIRGQIRILKMGEVPIVTSNADGSIQSIRYEEKGLPGGWYIVRANEDIFDSDNNILHHKGDIILPTNSNKNFIDLDNLDLSNYAKDNADQDGHVSFVGSSTSGATINIEEGTLTLDDGTVTEGVYVTDTNGQSEVEQLALGSYEVIEVKAPIGYTRDAETSAVICGFSESDISNTLTGSILKEVRFNNTRQKIDTGKPNDPEIVVEKNNPVIQVRKSADKECYAPGDTIHYTVTVSNIGDCDLENVELKDFLNNNAENSKVIGKMELLKKNTDQSYSYDYIIPADTKNGTTVLNTVTATGSSIALRTIPKKYVEDKDLEKVKVAINGVVVTKSANKRTYIPGETITYTVKITNTNKKGVSDNTIRNIIVNDRFLSSNVNSSELQFLSSNMDARVSMKNTTPVIQYLYPQETVTLKYAYKIPTAFVGNNIINEVSITADSGLSDRDQEEVYVANPNISVTKVADKDTYKLGEVVRYTITVKNTGTCDLKNVYLQEQLLGGAFQEKAGFDVNGTYAFVGDLAVNQSKTILFSYTIQEKDMGKLLHNVIFTEGTTIADDLDEEEIKVSDQDTETVNTGLRVGVRKIGYQDGLEIGVSGAEFSLYAREDIQDVFGTVIIPRDTLIEVATSQEDGYVSFRSDLPMGSYFVRETKTPEGYYSSNGIIFIDADNYIYNDQVAIVYRGGVIRNAASRVAISLHDEHSMIELEDATLAIEDKNGKEVKAWITKSTKDKGFVIYGLEPGETYTLVEKSARVGYVNRIIRLMSDSNLNASFSNSRVTFRIPIGSTTSNNTENDAAFGKINKDSIPKEYRIQITNDIVVGEVRVTKTGEVLNSWNLMDKTGQFFKSVFHYIFGGLENVEFTIYANQDIPSPDGNGYLYNKNDVVKTGVKSISKDAIGKTNDAGLVTFKELYLGEYYLVETQGISGYVEKKDPVEFSLVAVDDQTPIVYARDGGLSVVNERQEVEINVRKSSTEDENLVLANTEFGLFTNEDIKNVNGKVVVKKDTQIESGLTNANGIITFETSLPLSTYYVKETKAPTGYAISNEKFVIDAHERNSTDEAYTFDIKVKNPPDKPELEVDKAAPSTITPGGIIKYDLVKVANRSGAPVQNLVLVDVLPANTTIDSLYTGTYNEAIKLNVYYTTNLSKDVKLWKDNIPADKSMKLLVSDLKLRDREYINTFSISYGNVKAGFENIENPYYFVKVGSTAKKGTEFINTANLSALYNGKIIETTDKTLTKIPIEAAPKTGDDSTLIFWIIFTAGMASILGLFLSRRKLAKVLKKK